MKNEAKVSELLEKMEAFARDATRIQREIEDMEYHGMLPPKLTEKNRALVMAASDITAAFGTIRTIVQLRAPEPAVGKRDST